MSKAPFPAVGNLLKTNQIYQDMPKNIHQKLFSARIVCIALKTNITLICTDANIVE